VAAYPEISYAGTRNPRQMLDLFLPRQRAPGVRLPVVVYIHGGGWYRGSKAAGQTWLQPLVETGAYAGVAVNYRLAGEAPWPAQIHDCKAVIRWIRAHAARHGLDPDRIGVAGASAGGTLATLLGVSGGVRELEGEVGPHRDMSSRVHCVVNLFGRMNFLAEPESARAAPAQAQALAGRLTLLFGGPLEERVALARAASPVNHLTAEDPPIFTIHGTRDPTVPFAQATEIDAALKRAGLSHLLLVMEGFGHGFQNPEANRRARQFFDLHLRGLATKISMSPIVAPASPKSQKAKPSG
jgi:acetyl esterase/lipase